MERAGQNRQGETGRDSPLSPSQGAAYAAGPIRWLVVFAGIVTDTLRACLPTIWEAMLGESDRARTDRRIHWYVERLLGYPSVRVTVSNPHGITFRSGRPTIVMSNHRSLFDIPVIYHCVGGTLRMLTKKELFRIPIFGQALRAAEFVCVDRSDHQKALDALATAREQMESGVLVWISPEGTRSRDAKLGRFKKGGFMLALEAGAEIIPMGISGTERVLPAGKFFRLRCGEHVTVRIGKPVKAADYSIETRDEFLRAVKESIRRLSGEAAAC